jgi:hypothetical protein
VSFAAIVAALPGLVTLCRGEPQAQETFEYLKKASATLIENQHQQHDRLVKLEVMLDAHSLVRREQKEDITQKLLLLMTGAIAAAKARPAPVVAAPAVAVPADVRRREKLLKEQLHQVQKGRAMEQRPREIALPDSLAD